MSFPRPGAAIDLPKPVQARPGIRLIVFDFDGTLSWLRHGWPVMMCEVFLPQFLALGMADEEALRRELLEEILALNGHPSLRQSIRLSEMLRARGGPELEPEVQRDEFQRRLDAAIERRSARLRRGEVPASALLIHGILPFLEHAQAMGRELAILSTTVQERLEAETAELGLRPFFGRHVYGGTGDPRHFSKRAVFERMLAEEKITGRELLAFGDGPVELRDTKALGGLAVGVCSDEVENGSGRCDPHKRAGLLAAGADALIPDYRDAAPLLDHLLGL